MNACSAISNVNLQWHFWLFLGILLLSSSLVFLYSFVRSSFQNFASSTTIRLPYILEFLLRNEECSCLSLPKIATGGLRARLIRTLGSLSSGWMVTDNIFNPSKQKLIELEMWHEQSMKNVQFVLKRLLPHLKTWYDELLKHYSLLKVTLGLRGLGLRYPIFVKTCKLRPLVLNCINSWLVYLLVAHPLRLCIVYTVYYDLYGLK